MNIFNKKIMQASFFAVAIFLCAASAVLTKFLVFGFDIEYILSANFWGELVKNNANIILLSLLVFYQKSLSEEINNIEILNLRKATEGAYVEIKNKKLTSAFENYVKDVNAKSKIEAYYDKLCYKHSKAISQKAKDKYQALINRYETDYVFSKIKFEKVSSGMIFSKVKNYHVGNKYISNGSLYALKLLLSKIALIVLISMMLQSFFAKGQNFDISAVYNAAINLFQLITTYLFSYHAAVDYTRGELCDVFTARLSFVSAFLENQEVKEIKN